jgi:hypothetical protein
MQIEGTNSSSCPDEIEKELENARNEIEEYKKLQEEIFNENKKVTLKPTNFNWYTKTVRFENDLIMMVQDAQYS